MALRDVAMAGEWNPPVIAEFGVRRRGTRPSGAAGTLRLIVLSAMRRAAKAEIGDEMTITLRRDAGRVLQT